jgi:uncharacterized protein YcfJ
MKKSIIIAGIVSLFATSAFAQTVKAPVVNKVAEYNWTQQYAGTDTVCREEWVKQPTGQWNDGISGAIKGDGDAIAGAIIGGIIGNQFGGGRGKDVMTGLGVIVGSNVAKGTANKNGGRIRRTVCDEVPQYVRVKEIVGWSVTYSYKGRHYKVWLDEDPGTHVTLELSETHTVRN